MLVLGIETSCDDTSVSIVKDGKIILSNIISSQTEIHSEFGGIVPEIASRLHNNNILPVLEESLETANVEIRDIDLIAVTNEPGLIGSLLVGLVFAKGLAYSLKIPLIEINHLSAHLYAVNLENDNIVYPAIGLLISGGHTLLVKSSSYTDFEIIGSTVDDAIGEAFDKVAKLLGLGYPGGPIVEKYAMQGEANIDFPKPLINKDNLNFSFSGLKTAVLYYLKENINANKYDVCASFQNSVQKVLIKKILKTFKKYPEYKTLIIGGGVAANKTMTSAIKKELFKKNIKVYIPSIKLCVDNAAMVAGIGARLGSCSNN